MNRFCSFRSHYKFSWCCHWSCCWGCCHCRCSCRSRCCWTCCCTCSCSCSCFSFGRGRIGINWFAFWERISVEKNRFESIIVILGHDLFIFRCRWRIYDRRDGCWFCGRDHFRFGSESNSLIDWLQVGIRINCFLSQLLQGCEISHSFAAHNGLKMEK